MTEQIQGPTIDDLPVLERLHAENARHLETLFKQVQDAQQAYINHQGHQDVLGRQIAALRQMHDDDARLRQVDEDARFAADLQAARTQLESDAEMDQSVRAMRRVLEQDEDREQLAATMRQKLQRNVQE